ncbi:MAG: hypothetical protein V2G42_06905 [bacterium JZ-2024 1]
MLKIPKLPFIYLNPLYPSCDYSITTIQRQCLRGEATCRISRKRFHAGVTRDVNGPRKMQELLKKRCTPDLLCQREQYQYSRVAGNLYYCQVLRN